MHESDLPYDPPRDPFKESTGLRHPRRSGLRTCRTRPTIRGAVSYDALARETMAQWQHVKNTGLKIDWITPPTGDPYAENPRMALRDIRDNNHWWGYRLRPRLRSTGEDMKAPEPDARRRGRGDRRPSRRGQRHLPGHRH